MTGKLSFKGGSKQSSPNLGGKTIRRTMPGGENNNNKPGCEAMKRLTILGTSALLLGGCALPVPIQVASWALDGISYLTTEKSVADHGLSILAQKDCSVLRGLLDDGEICRDNDDATTLLADRGPGNGFTTTDGTEELAALGDVEQLANFETAAGGPSASEVGAVTNARLVTSQGTGQGDDQGTDHGGGNGVNPTATRVSVSHWGHALWLVPGAHWGVYVAFGVFVFVLTLRRIN